MSENTVIVNPMGNKELKQELAVSDKINCIDVSTLSEKQSIFSVSIGDNRYLTIMAYVHGVSELNSVMPIVTDDGCFISVESNLIKGRLISNNDIQTKNAVVAVDVHFADVDVEIVADDLRQVEQQPLPVDSA